MALVLRYGVVGALNTGVGFIVIAVSMSAAGLTPASANAVGFFAGYLSGYVLHRRWTFRSSVPHGRGLAAYLAVTVIGYAANLAVLLGLIAWGVKPLLAQALAVTTYVALTFVLNASFVFRRVR